MTIFHYHLSVILSAETRKKNRTFMLLLDSQELEYLLEHLGHPETLKEKKFQEWLLDNDHRLLFERVRDYREAYLRVDKGEMIDLAKEWEQFEVNVQ